jgi:hypothetical protein
MKHGRKLLASSVFLAALSIVGYGHVGVSGAQETQGGDTREPSFSAGFDRADHHDAEQMVNDGKQTFRFDTFGDEAFWGDTLHLHQAVEGAHLGGVGPGVSPSTALAVGLKVDVDALPPALIAALKQGKVNLADPATTLALLKLNSVVPTENLVWPITAPAGPM